MRLPLIGYHKYNIGRMSAAVYMFLEISEGDAGKNLRVEEIDFLPL